MIGALRRAASLALVLAAGPAMAQTARPAPALRPWRPLVSLGGVWVGADDVGERKATTRQAAIGTTTPAPSTLFATASTLGGAAAGELGVTVPVTPAWAVELRGSTGRPSLETTITGDVEGSGTFTASETISEYVVDASVVRHLPEVRLGAHAMPYVLGGGGYLRQLHDERTLVETGSTWHAGAGVRWWLRGGVGPARAVGATTEVRWVWRRDGITFDDSARSLPTVSLRVFVGL